MGIETVDINYRRESLEHFEGVECDIASAKIHHTMNPTKNYIFVEFKIPTIAKHMPSVDYNKIVETYFYDCMHQMKYIKVDNKTFHAFMNREGVHRNQDNRSCGEMRNEYYSYREREGIDVVRHKENGRVVTHYNSNKRLLGLLRHDYYMALLLYANWPKRDFLRRTPCKIFSPLCSDCPKFAKLPVVGWIDDPEPFKPTIEKTFFSYIGENHRLCMGYTIDIIPSGDTCYKPIEPEYYILDLDVIYFREAIYKKSLWENTIIKNRKDCNEELYSFGGPITNYDGELLTDISWSDWAGPHTALSVTKYNLKKRGTVPSDIWTAVSLSNMTMLWEADIHRFNNRNSAHKYTFNSWWQTGMHNDDGWFCGVNTAEIIAEATAPFGAEGTAVAGQLTQVANMFGMDEGAGGSPDTVYSLLEPLHGGYSYQDITEPLPKRADL